MSVEELLGTKEHIEDLIAEMVHKMKEQVNRATGLFGRSANSGICRRF